MTLVLGMVFVFGLVLAANFVTAAQKPQLNKLFDLFLILINLPIFFIGALLLAFPADLLSALMQGSSLPTLNWPAAGWTLTGMGLWGVLVSLRPVRQGLGRIAPLNADLPMHTLALVLSGFLVGNTIFSLTQGGLEELAATAVSASIFDILLMQALFVGVAVLGIGLYIRRTPQDARQRLGLTRPTLQQLLTGIGWIVVLVVLQALGGALWTLMDSSQAKLVENISGELLGNIDTFGEWLLLAMATGLGEELLFRGALQPVFGLGFTALLFAFAHVQYGLTPVTLVVFVIGIVLGLIRRKHGTAVSIFVHSGYNFALGMISLLAMQYANTLP
ncbi:MAG: CPBP family intramembrane metalloprotease [Chloroflexi bacterium]|nr:CPBP family intramembrane metalloprotease [Chloroflexota bacterium]